MRRFKKMISLVLTFLLLATTYPAQAATDLSQFNANDLLHLQNFLNQPSAVSGKTNGEMLNPAYDQNNPDAWIGVEWGSEIPKKVISIGNGNSWEGKSLAGALDLSNCTELEYVNCSNNQITQLDIKDSTELMTLHCNNNRLTYLDLSGSYMIYQLYCQDNFLTSLNLSSQRSMDILQCGNNRLTDIQAYFIEGNLYVTAVNSGYVELYLYRMEGSIQVIATAVPAPGASLERWILSGEIDAGKVNPLDLWEANYYRAEANFTESELPQSYTVTFNPNGGERTGGGKLSQSVLAGNSALEPILYRYGYYYSWDRSCSEVTGDITVNAIWYPEVSPYPGEPSVTPTQAPPSPAPPVAFYSVTFDPNGGTRTGGGNLRQYVTLGDGASAPKVAREGYTFVGWDVPYDKITSDLTVIAKWQPFTVTFDPNGGSRTGGGELIQKVESGAAAAAPEVARENHLFDSWDSDFSSVSKDMTVKALWALKKLNVTFDPDGGTRTSGGELSQKVEYGGSAEEPILEKKGYTFEDWDMDYSNVTEDLTITALWEGSDPAEELPEEELYTITYDLNGGAGEAPVDKNEYTKGDEAELADGAGLDYDNYTFIGWSLEPDGEVLSEATITVKEDTVLYAIWEEAKASKPVPKTGAIPGLAYGIPMLLSGSALVGLGMLKKKRQRNR